MSKVFLLKRGKIIFQVLPSCHYQQAGFLGQNYSACMKRWLRDEGEKNQNPKKEPLNHTATKLSSSQGLAEENVQNQLPGETITAGLCAFCCCCFPSHQCRGYHLLDCSWHSNITGRCIWTEHKEVEMQARRTRTDTRTILHIDALQIKKVKPVGRTRGWKEGYIKYHKKNQFDTRALNQPFCPFFFFYLPVLLISSECKNWLTRWQEFSLAKGRPRPFLNHS